MYLFSNTGGTWATVQHALERRAMLRSIERLLNWDQRTTLPAAGAPWRAKQASFIAAELHALLADPELADALEHCAKRTSSDDERAVLRELEREARRARAVPRSLAAEVTSLAVETTEAWEAAKETNTFSLVLPHFERLIKLKREEAALLAEGREPYAGLMERYEPDLSVAEVASLFSELAPPIQRLLAEAAGDPRFRDVPDALGPFPADKQEVFLRELMRGIGFRPEVFQTSTHPFCDRVGPEDVRITTRYSDNDLFPGLLAALHEAGHGIYEQSLPCEHYGTPLGEARSLAVHESQSLLWENIVGRAPEFWEFWFPNLQRTFLDAFSSWNTERFWAACARVKPALIRVDADEVSYPLHIIIRFELERLLVNGSIEAVELPELWRERYQAYLGIAPANDAEGVLQDIHWYSGNVGYFPAYLTGFIYGAQLYRTFLAAHPEWPQQLARGETAALRDWLTQAVYRHGRRYSAVGLIQRVTGEPPAARFLLEYLRQKYIGANPS
ncbi:MAG: carboxypeptidase M32 [Bdellovibrionales bacterium]|nr:carboxypeptidase M32 [Bdellovibrionales bacterium]